MFIEGTLTPTEERVWRVIHDGNRHTADEIALVIDEDGLCSRKNVVAHVVNIRKKLTPGYGIISEFVNKRCFYRLIRYISTE